MTRFQEKVEKYNKLTRELKDLKDRIIKNDQNNYTNFMGEEKEIVRKALDSFYKSSIATLEADLMCLDDDLTIDQVKKVA